MQLPYSWIKELVNIDWSPEELADRLTLSGAETEVEYLTEIPFDNIVIGEVLECGPVPESDHLSKCLVTDGTEKIPVVCGAPNVAKGQKIVLAKVGAELAGGFKIKKAKLRGVESHGMICSERELGISEDHSGIMVLDEKAPVGKPFFKTMGLDDAILKLDLTPNRADLMSAFGVARDVSCLSGKPMVRPEFEIDENSEKASDYVKVGIADPDACPRYAARIIKNITVKESPWWLQRRLMLSGIRPISNIVDIANLVMLETGHPLHAFDYDTFKRKEILVRRAKEGEKFTTLDGKEHTLNPDVLLITDGAAAVGVGGIMGGLDSEVTDGTRNILLEAAFFDSRTTRRGRQKLGITSEAQARFEKGADPNMVEYAINRAAALMAQLGEGELVSGIVDCYPKRIEPKKVTLRPDKVNVLLGTKLSKERMIEILRAIEFGVEDKGNLEVTVPTFTSDITREADLAEEIIRLEGYEAVPYIDENKGPLFAPYPEDEAFKDNIRKVLTGQGYDEVYSGGLADPKLLSSISDVENPIQVINPIAEDLKVMETTMLYTLFKSAGHNISHRNIDLQLFVVGKVYLPGDPPVENYQIGLLVTGGTSDSWLGKGRELGYFDLKGAIEALTCYCRLPELEYRPKTAKILVESTSHEILMGGQKIGVIGEVNSNIARLFDVKQKLFVGLLDFEELLAHRKGEAIYRPLPKFPAAPRDLAVTVNEGVKVGEIIAAIRKNGGHLLEIVTLFDLFRGKQIGEGKKSLAFSMIYRSPERSLEAEEVQAVHNRIADNLKKEFGAEIREG